MSLEHLDTLDIVLSTNGVSEQILFINDNESYIGYIIGKDAKYDTVFPILISLEWLSVILAILKNLAEFKHVLPHASLFEFISTSVDSW